MEGAGSGGVTRSLRSLGSAPGYILFEAFSLRKTEVFGAWGDRPPGYAVVASCRRGYGMGTCSVTVGPKLGIRGGDAVVGVLGPLPGLGTERRPAMDKRTD